MYALALSDYHFDEKELEEILSIGREKGISKERFEEIIINPTAIEISYPVSFLEKVHLLFDFTRVIWADGMVTESERSSFHKFCERFGFGPEESEELFGWLLSLVKSGVNADQLESELMKLNQE